MTTQDIENRLRAVEDASAMLEISNLMAKYEYLAEELEWDRIVDEIYADEWMGELTHIGTIKNKEEMRTIYKAQGDVYGKPFIHMLNTPYIEVNGDTAKGVWYCLCAGTTPQQEPQAFWVMVKYLNDFVLQDGKWKMSHMRVHYYFATPYQDGWAKTPLMEGYDAGGQPKELRPNVHHWLPTVDKP